MTQNNKIFVLNQIKSQLRGLTQIRAHISVSDVYASRPIRDTTAATPDVRPSGGADQSTYDELRAAVWTAVLT